MSLDLTTTNASRVRVPDGMAPPGRKREKLNGSAPARATGPGLILSLMSVT